MKKTYKTSIIGTLIKKLSFGYFNLETEIIYKEKEIEINCISFNETINYKDISNIKEEYSKIKIYYGISEVIYLKFLHPSSVESIYNSINEFISIFHKASKLKQEKELKEKEERLKNKEKKELELKMQNEAKIAILKQKEEEKRKEKIRQNFDKDKKIVDEIYTELYNIYQAKKYFSGTMIKEVKILLEDKTINNLFNIYEKDILERTLDKKIINISKIKNNINGFVKEVRKRFLDKALIDNESFFNNLSKFGLKKKQRIACLVNNDNNLVIAGAGSGKTLVMLARAAYLIKEKIVNSHNILILAYNKKARLELKSRSKDIHETKVYHYKQPNNIATFHSLGKSIIETVDGKVYNVIRESKQKNILKKALLKLMNHDVEFINRLFIYFKFYIYPYPDIGKYKFKSLGEYAEFMKLRNIRPVNPDNEPFGTYDECIIANFLYFNNIKYDVNKTVEDCKNIKASFHLIDFNIYIFYENNSFKSTYKTTNTTLECLKEKKFFIINYKDCISPPIIEQKVREGIESFDIDLQELTVAEIIKKIESSNLINEITRLLKQFIGLYKNASENKLILIKEEHSNKEIESSKRIMFFIEIFESILDEYEKELKSIGAIDFDDMIFKANKYVKDGLFKSPYEYIMIDEFQDISYARAELIKNLLKISNKPNLFCVGDDWQAIYRFSGSELRFVTNFKNEFSNNNNFGYSKTLLDYTFRFNDKILTTSSNFVQENSNQEKKKINVITRERHPKVNIILKNSEITEEIVNKVLNKIKKRQSTTKETEILILSRYHNYKGIKESREDIENYFENEVSRKYNMKIRYASIHSSKGQEADYVILIDVKGGFRAFPSMRDSDEIIEMMLPPKETNIDFAEERRLMYVALTRAKKEVWIEADFNEMSPFIREFIDKKDYFKVRILNLTKFIDKYNIIKKQINCPMCSNGKIIERINKKGDIFYACNNFPVCNYTLKRCLECNAESSVIRESETRYKCFKCNNKFKVCSECNDGVRTLMIYNNPKGKVKQIYCSNNKLLNCRPKDKGIEFHPETDVIFPNLLANKKKI